MNETDPFNLREMNRVPTRFGSSISVKSLRNRILAARGVMNYPGVLTDLPGVVEKLILFQDRIIDGYGAG